MSLFHALVLLAFFHNGAAYDEYQDSEDDQNIDADFDDQYESENEDIIMTMTRITSTDPGTRFRIKRFEDHSSGARTLSQDEIRDVKGALKELLAGQQLDRLTTNNTETTTNDVFSINEEFTKGFTFSTPTQKIEFLDATEFYNDLIDEIIDNAKRQGLLRTVTSNVTKTETSTIFQREKSTTDDTQLTYTIVLKPQRTPEIPFVPEKAKDIPKTNKDFFQSQNLYQDLQQKTEDKFEENEDFPIMERKYPDIFRDFTGINQGIPEWIKNFPREGQIVPNRTTETFNDNVKMIEDMTSSDKMSVILKDEIVGNDEDNDNESDVNNGRKFGFIREGKNDIEGEVTSEGKSNVEVADKVTVAASSVSSVDVADNNNVEATSANDVEVMVEVTSASDGLVTDKGAVKVTSASEDEVTGKDAVEITTNDVKGTGNVVVDETSVSDVKGTDNADVEVASNVEGSSDVKVDVTNASDVKVKVNSTNEGDRQGDDEGDDEDVDEEQSMFKRTTTSTTTTTMRTLKMADPHYYPYPYSSMLYPETTEKPNTTTTLWRTKRRRTTTPTITTTQLPQLDIPRLVAIIANLTNDFESNITDMFNQTLQKYNIPTCPNEEITEPPVYHELANATVVAKCFVCGLTEAQIPIDSFCSDAFAVDFIPLIPMNPQSRGRIGRYRRYCRYLDVDNFYENATEPRSVYGRFTGGCSVRWIDISSVYTQRACRNRRHAITGRHFGSKRMAKLEMTLHDVDNGCIVSPMATLIPLSRGISLYARFHACVCTGSWCNVTAENLPWIPYIAMFIFCNTITVLMK